MKYTKQIRSQKSEQGTAFVEFVLCVSLFWIPLFFGAMVLGFNLVRAIQVTQLCRNAAHMHAYTADFSQSSYQNILISQAPGLNITTTGGNGVIILSTISYADSTACQAQNFQSSCSNQGNAVITRRIVIGNSSIHQSSFGTPDSSLLDSGGNIKPSDYLTNSSTVADGFLSIIPLQASTQYAYVAEVWVTSPDYSWWNFLGLTGSSARAIF